MHLLNELESQFESDISYLNIFILLKGIYDVQKKEDS